MSDIPTLPPQVDTQIKTRTMTKVTVALVAGLVIAAAAAGIAVMQLSDQLSFISSPASTTSVQEARGMLLTGSNSPSGARFTFTPNVDLAPNTTIIVTLPQGVTPGRVTVGTSSNLDGVIETDINGQQIEISRVQGRSTVAAGSASVTVTLYNVSFGSVPVNQTVIAVETPVTTSTPAPDEAIGEERPTNDGSNTEDEADEVLTGLSIVAPSGEDVLLAGQSYLVQWSAQGDASAPVMVEYTYDGSYWEVLNEGIASLVGRVSWNIPLDVDTRLARVRVTGEAADGSQVRATSNPLTIVPPTPAEDGSVTSESVSDGSESTDGTEVDGSQSAPNDNVAEDGSLLGAQEESVSVELIEPNGNEVYEGGESVRIAWELNAPDADRVHLYFSEDSTNYSIIASNVPADNGSYMWNLPNIDTDKASIRVAARVYGGRRIIEDYTDASFVVRRQDVADDGSISSNTSGNPDGSAELEEEEQVEQENVGTVVSGGGGNGGRYGSNFQASPATSVGPGELLKIQCPPVVTSVNDPCRAVYYVTGDGQRHAFPNSKVYFSWFTDFSEVEEISAAEMQSYRIGSNVTYRPGYVMVKFQTLNTVYAVSANGVLRPIMTEAVARGLYGSDWNRRVHDISDAFYGNYTFGAPVVDASQYDPSSAMASVEGLWQNF